MPERSALFIDTRQVIDRADVPPALVGHLAVDSPFDIQGWLWDDRFWTEPSQENVEAIIPTLYDPSTLGLTPDFFQSGIGDHNDLLITDVIERRIDDRDTWMTELLHGTYFRGKERRYLYSDDSVVQYLDDADNVDGRNVLQLDYKLKETIPVSIETYKRSIVTGDYYVYNSINPRLEFTGKLSNGVPLPTLVDAKIVWDNVDTDAHEAVIINDLNPQKLIFNKDNIRTIGKELPNFTERIILEKMGDTNEGIENLLVRTKHFPIIRDDSLHVYLANENSNERSGPFNIVSVTSSTKTIVVSNGHFVEDNVEPGDMLEIAGGNANDGTYTVDSVTDDNTVVVVEAVVDTGAVGEAGQFVYLEWTRVDDFRNSGPTDTHFVVDKDLGEITFGDDIHGMIPPLFNSVYITYRYTYKVEYEAENTRDTILAREVNLNPAVSSTTTGFLFLTEEQVNIGSLELISNERLVPGFDALFGPVTVGNDFALITATLRDTLFQPMPDVPVTFSIINNPPVGTINGTDTVVEVNTNGRGQAIAFYNPPTNVDTFGYYSITQTNGNQTLVLDDTSARITDASTVYVFQVRKDDLLQGKAPITDEEIASGGVPFVKQAQPLSMNGRKVIIYEYDADYVHPHTEEVGAYGPMQPSSVDGGFMLNFDTPLATCDPDDDLNPIAGYWVISTRVTVLQASAWSPFLGRTVTSNELKLQISLPEHMLGVYVAPSGDKIPFGFRLKDNVIVAASALGGATFLGLNPPTAPDNLSLARSGDYDITISWDNTWIFDASPVKGFTIYRSIEDGVWEFVGVADGTDVDFEDVNVPLGDRNYKYQVRTDIQGASSEWEVSSNFFLTEPCCYATGWLEVIDNAALANTVINIDGKTLTQGEDWIVGANEEETMESIAEAIQTQTKNVNAVVGPICSVDLTARKPGADGNLIDLGVTGTGITSSHNYGYPTFGAVEPNVTEQWLFDEASGSSYGEVINFRLDPSGSKTYNATACGAFRNLSPGIYCTSGDMRRQDTWGNTLVPLHMATQEFEIEIVCKKPPTMGTYQYMWYLNGAWKGSYASSMRFYWYNDQLGISQHELYGADVTRWVPVNASWDDGKEHHYRVTGKWRQQMQVFVDGQLEATTNWTYWPGVNDPWYWSAGVYPSGIRWGSTGYTLYEGRYTIGNRTNNSFNNDSTGPGVVFSGSTLTGGAI
jgi:hypothetical protein